jgi:hypothetical protein
MTLVEQPEDAAPDASRRVRGPMVGLRRLAKSRRPKAPEQVGTDAQLLELWLHGRSEHTQRAFGTDSADLLVFVGRPLRDVTVADVQAWMDSFEQLAPASRARQISSVTSLLRLGAPPRLSAPRRGARRQAPEAQRHVAERILSETEVHQLLLCAGQESREQYTAAQQRRSRRKLLNVADGKFGRRR